MYVYIVHIKITLHMQVLWPTQNLKNLFYTAKNIRCQQLQESSGPLWGALRLAHHWVRPHPRLHTMGAAGREA